MPLRSCSRVRPLLDLDTDCILNVEAAPASLSADKAYGSGPLLGWLVDWNITPYIPVVERGRQRDAFFTRDAFRYGRDADAYRCPADKLLGYCGTNCASQVRVYRSRPADCTACDLNPQCTIASSAVSPA